MQFRSGKSKGAKPHRPISNAAGTNRTCVAFKQFRRRHVRVTNASQGRKAWHEYEKCFHGLRCGPVRAYSHRFRRTHEHNKFEANRALANTDRAGSVSLLWRIWRLELGRGARGRGARLAVGWRPGGNGRLAVLRRGLRLSFLQLGVWESLLRWRLRLPLLRRRLRLSVLRLGVWESLLRRRLRLPLLRLVFVLRQALWLLRGSYASYPRYRYYGAYNQPSYRRYAYHGWQNYRQYGYRQNRQYAYRGGIYTGRSVGYRQTQRGHYR